MESAHRKNRTIIHAGRIFCATSGVDGPGSVVINGDRIESIHTSPGQVIQNSSPVTNNNRILNFPDGILLPGLIDLHAHPANAGSVFGVPPDETMLTRGVTTVMSQGDAGAENIDQYVEQTIRKSKVKVLLAINLSRIGESTSQGCFEEIDNANVDECVAATVRHRNHVKAVAVNTSHHACGRTDPRKILQRGILAATETSLPILYGMRRPEDWPLDEQLALLRPGDIVTYCFRREPHCIVQNGRVLPCVKDARQRGILFDIGHGRGSFSFDVAEAAINDGFPPDTISTDLQKGHLENQPIHDLPLVMSKLSAAGMADADIFRAVTSTPAKILRLGNNASSLKTGEAANLTVLTQQPGITLSDTHETTRTGNFFSAACVMRNGYSTSKTLL